MGCGYKEPPHPPPWWPPLLQAAQILHAILPTFLYPPPLIHSRPPHIHSRPTHIHSRPPHIHSHPPRIHSRPTKASAHPLPPFGTSLCTGRLLQRPQDTPWRVPDLGARSVVSANFQAASCSRSKAAVEGGAGRSLALCFPFQGCLYCVLLQPRGRRFGSPFNNSPLPPITPFLSPAPLPARPSPPCPITLP